MYLHAESLIELMIGVERHWDMYREQLACCGRETVGKGGKVTRVGVSIAEAEPNKTPCHLLTTSKTRLPQNAIFAPFHYHFLLVQNQPF